jgi:hypothetical protein
LNKKKFRREEKKYVNTFFAIDIPNSPVTAVRKVSFDDAYTIRALTFVSGGHVKMKTSAEEEEEEDVG